MTVLISLLTMLVLAAGFSVWLALGLGGLVGLTAGIAEFCQSLFVKCLAYSHMARLTFLWLGALTFASGLLYGLFKGIGGFLRARRAVKALPIKAEAGPIVLIDDTVNRIAFTHGLLNPRIYLSRGLLADLTHDELKGVFLHELHHKRALDPLRFFLVNLLRDSFFYLPLAGFFSEHVRARGEDRADRSAAESMAEPLSLASALVKVARHATCPEAYPATALTGLAGKSTGTVEARARRLLEGGRLEFASPGRRPMAISLFITVFLLTSFVLPLFNAPRSVEACTTEHCSTHIKKLGDDCTTHCELHTNASH